ncbi:MAG: glutaredoxin family protein [Gemmataceae bacterium]|nr:glutaredoxin family protein [Gemmataceae bacterium]
MVLGWLRSWWRGHARGRLEGMRVVMYTRQGCHLCEDAWALLEGHRARHGFTLVAVDVDADPDLAARHGREVPVVEIDGKVRFRGVVNPHLLERLLYAEARRR